MSPSTDRERQRERDRGRDRERDRHQTNVHQINSYTYTCDNKGYIIIIMGFMRKMGDVRH
jgi:hypothetical protein